MAPIIEVEGLRKRYGRHGPEAVAGLSFRVEPGEIYGLLGPNGAGKSTTIGVLTTRVRPTAGTIRIDGIDVVRDPVAVKLRIAVVPQRSNLDRSLTALENLTFHAAYFGARRAERRTRALEILAQLGLEGREGDQVNAYSGGMAQRLMIARALMHEPKVLFLDEPTTGLDPQSRLFLWDRIAELRARGVTILLTTHDMHEADRLCARIAVVDHGRLIAEDTPAGLRGLLPGAHGLALTVSGPPGDDAAALAGLGRVEVAELDGGRRQLRVFGESGPGELLRAADAAGLEVHELRRLEGSLEDVFVHLTGRELR